MKKACMESFSSKASLCDSWSAAGGSQFRFQLKSCLLGCSILLGGGRTLVNSSLADSSERVGVWIFSLNSVWSTWFGQSVVFSLEMIFPNFERTKNCFVHETLIAFWEGRLQPKLSVPTNYVKDHLEPH